MCRSQAQTEQWCVCVCVCVCAVVNACAALTCLCIQVYRSQMYRQDAGGTSTVSRGEPMEGRWFVMLDLLSVATVQIPDLLRPAVLVPSRCHGDMLYATAATCDDRLWFQAAPQSEPFRKSHSTCIFATMYIIYTCECTPVTVQYPGFFSGGKASKEGPSRKDVSFCTLQRS